MTPLETAERVRRLLVDAAAVSHQLDQYVQTRPEPDYMKEKARQISQAFFDVNLEDSRLQAINQIDGSLDRLYSQMGATDDGFGMPVDRFLDDFKAVGEKVASLLDMKRDDQPPQWPQYMSSLGQSSPALRERAIDLAKQLHYFAEAEKTESNKPQRRMKPLRLPTPGDQTPDVADDTELSQTPKPQPKRTRQPTKQPLDPNAGSKPRSFSRRNRDKGSEGKNRGIGGI